MKRAIVLFAALAACGRDAAMPARPGLRWVVVAPHPDDETLIAAGLVRRAVEAREDVDVIVMTNGDYDCVHDGLLREGESLTGMRAVGLPPERVHFLGYPDGGLARLGRRPLAAKRRIEGRCESGDTTYGVGVEPRAHTRANAVADLARLFARMRPTDVATLHPEDTHPDHAATYSLVRAALASERLTPTIHRALVHNGDCWPTGTAPHEPCPAPIIAPGASLPPLTGRLAGYVPAERRPVPESCLVADPSRNPKLLAIAAHASQTRGTLESYLFAFAKREEPFFPESAAPYAGPRLMRDAQPGDRLEHAGYRVTIERGRAVLEAPPREWPLPDDLWEGAEVEPFTLVVKRVDGVNEIVLSVRDGIAGVAVDVSAFPSARRAP